MQATLIADLVTGTLSETLGGGEFTFPAWVQGDQHTIKIRLAEKSGDNVYNATRIVRGWQAGLGFLDQRPSAGGIRLCIGEGPWTEGVNKTGVLAATASGPDIKLALDALSGDGIPKPFTVSQVKGSYVITADGGVAFALTTADNSLDPISLAHVRPGTFDGVAVRELRFVQAPVAFTDQQSRILPASPVIIRTDAMKGRTIDGQRYPELQDLFAPAEFDSTFILTWKGRDSLEIDPAVDTEAEVLAALAPLADAGGTFKVTSLPRRVMRIEFGGSMAGAEQELMQVEILSPPEGDITFTLPLDRYELAAALRDAPASGVVFPFEIRALFEDVADSGIIRRVTIHRGEVTVLPELLWSEMGVPPNIDWLKPWQPVSYEAEDPRNIVATTQHAPFYLGDGINHEFTRTHRLGTLDILMPELYEVATGRMMVMARSTTQLDDGTADYICHILNTNQVKITLAAANIPATNALRLVISTAGPVTAFLNGITINQSQVNGLQGRFTGIADRVGELERVVLVTGGGSTAGIAATDIVLSVDLPKLSRVFPWRGAQPDFADFKALGDAIVKAKLRPLGLLPALSTATITTLPVPVPAPAVSQAGKVFQNQSGSAVDVSFPLLGHRSFTLLPDEFAMSDGRLWWKARRFAAENTWYPQDFEQELFVIPVDGDALAIGRTLSCDFVLTLATVNADTNFQWVLEIRWASLTADAFTTGVGPNLNEVAWHATPLVSKRIMVTSSPTASTFGLRINRTGASSWVSSAIVMGTTKAASGITEPNFVLGAFLCRADTENKQSDPRGFVGLLFPDAPGGGSSDSLGKLTIK